MMKSLIKKVAETTVLTGTLSTTVYAGTLCLENRYWKLDIEPEYGGRSSSLYCKPANWDFVRTWKPATVWLQKEKSYAGGVFGGHMGGSYSDEQTSSRYDVIKSTPDSITMRWKNSYSLFDGLVETRTIKMDPEKPIIKLQIDVCNESDEKRTIYYRMQDFIGIGFQNGYDSVYSVPGSKICPNTFGFAVNTPATQWFDSAGFNTYVMADLIKDSGLFIRVKKGRLKNIMFWLSKPEMRTGELFFEACNLAPGESWHVEIDYGYFKPSQPKTGDTTLNKLIAKKYLEKQLDNRSARLNSGIVYSSTFKYPVSQSDSLVVIPMHQCDSRLGTGCLPEYAGTLKQINIQGVPGETVSCAVAIKAAKKIDGVAVNISDFKNKSDQDVKGMWQLDYVSNDGFGYLVKELALAKNMPDKVGHFGNDLKDAEKLSPLSMSNDDMVYMKATYHISKQTPSGNYTAVCHIGDTSFNIGLKIYPFDFETIKKQGDKTYGTFFRAKLKEEAKGGMSKNEYEKALQMISTSNYKGLVLYLYKIENIKWALDKLAELGWRNAAFVLINPILSQKELDEYKNKYGFNIYAWGVDEPRTYKMIDKTVKKYKLLKRRGKTNNVFTPNVPLGLVAADLLTDLTPIMAINGYPPFVLDKTQEYKKQGRNVYWYAGHIKPTVRGRMMRGIYLWKEPVDGFFDWGEDIYAKRKGALCGFIGGRMITTIRRDNAGEGLKDYLYLKKLEDLCKNGKKVPAVNEGKAFMKSLKQFFGSDFVRVARQVDQTYLDHIRTQAADLSEKIIQQRSL